MADRRKSSDLSIADYFQAARFHPWAVVLPMIAIGVLAWLLVGRADPVFQAEAKVQVGSTEAQRSFDQDRGNDANELPNEQRFAKSDTVLDELRARLGPDAPENLDSLDLKVEIDDTADILTFSAKGPTAVVAADRANLYADVFVQQRRETAVAGYSGAIDLIEGELEEIRAERTSVREPLDAVIIRLAPLAPDSNQRPLLEEERATLESRLAPQLTFLDNQESAFIENLSNLRISQSLAQTGTAAVSSAAIPDPDPLPSAGTRALIVGELVGLILGLILAITIHNMDDRIRESSDVERYFPDLPILGAVPYETAVRKNRELTVLAAPHSSFAESIYQVRTSLRFMNMEQGVRLVVVTSANPSEGKTTFTANFAWSLAGLNEPVVLIDGDLRRPVAHQHFGVEISPGLTDFVIDGRPLSSVAVTFEEQDGNFSLVPAGTHHGNPADFMGSTYLVDAIKDISREAMTVVDAAPVLPVSDSRAIAGASDLTIVMVRMGSTKRSDLAQAIRNLRNAGADSIALVLVGVKPESSTYYGMNEKRARSDGAAHPSQVRSIAVAGMPGAVRPRPVPVSAEANAARTAARAANPGRPPAGQLIDQRDQAPSDGPAPLLDHRPMAPPASGPPVASPPRGPMTAPNAMTDDDDASKARVTQRMPSTGRARGSADQGGNGAEAQGRGDESPQGPTRPRRPGPKSV